MSDKPLLSVQNLSKFYPVRGGIFARKMGVVRAVDDVSFVLNEGETLSLVGESGCGKSTLGRTILRLEEATAGKALLDGVDIHSMGRKELFALRRHMQMIFQDPYSSLNPRMTVGEIVEEPVRIHRFGEKPARQQAEELFARVGLQKEMLDRYPHEFSGGQRQRIGIARALALRPRLIIADEPVSALDVSVQAQVLNLLVELQREFKLTYLFISHDLSVVDYISDRIAIMYLGRIVEIGTRSEIMNRTAHPYTKALLASSPIPDPRRRSAQEPLKGEIPSPINPPSGCTFHPRCPMATEQCRRQVPLLEAVPVGDIQHLSACHRKAELV